MGEAFEKLRGLCATIYDLVGANEVLSWDEQTYMPPGGGGGRARQHATLERLSHELFVSDKLCEAREAVGAATRANPRAGSSPRREVSTLPCLTTMNRG